MVQCDLDRSAWHLIGAQSPSPRLRRSPVIPGCTPTVNRRAILARFFRPKLTTPYPVRPYRPYGVNWGVHGELLIKRRSVCETDRDSVLARRTAVVRRFVAKDSRFDRPHALRQVPGLN